MEYHFPHIKRLLLFSLLSSLVVACTSCSVRLSPLYIWGYVKGVQPTPHEAINARSRPCVAAGRLRASRCVKVDQEGVEPSSKRGNRMLSTRLSPTSFSCCGKTGATNRNLILCEFRSTCEARPNYLRFCCTTMSRSFGARALG